VAELGRLDSRFAQAVNASPSDARLKEALQQAGAGAVGYKLMGSIPLAFGESIDLNGIQLVPVTAPTTKAK
jgi:hypothetical protein